MEMRQNSLWKDGLIVGLALFSTMFGAGNLIFPPQIGLFSGTAWVMGALGLLLTGIVLPVLALWAVNNTGDGPEDLMGHVHPRFYQVFFLINCTLIGMGSTLPRSAATAHEIGVQGLFPNAPIWVTVVVFFILVYLFANDRNSVIDKLGKYLTPLLLIMLAIVLIKGVVSPPGVPVDTGIQNPAGKAMLTAYNTGDLTVGLLFSGVILGDLGRRGYTGAQRKKGGILVGLVCIVALFAIYGTLTYLGAAAGSSFAQDTPQTALLSGVVSMIMGRWGLGCLGVAVALACLTTAVGIGTTIASFFNDLFNGRIPYRVWIIILCVVGTLMGITGVQNIINYVTPIFLVVYPICIVLTALGLLNRFVPNDGVYIGGVLMAGVVSLGPAILAVNPGLTGLANVMDYFPLNGAGFSWLVPALLGMAVGGVLFRNRPKYTPAPKAQDAPAA